MLCLKVNSTIWTMLLCWRCVNTVLVAILPQYEQCAHIWLQTYRWRVWFDNLREWVGMHAFWCLTCIQLLSIRLASMAHLSCSIPKRNVVSVGHLADGCVINCVCPCQLANRICCSITSHCHAWSANITVCIAQCTAKWWQRSEYMHSLQAIEYYHQERLALLRSLQYVQLQGAYVCV